MSNEQTCDTPPCLDPCCGSRMMWFDKIDTRALFGDCRQEKHSYQDRHYTRHLEISPDVQLDFRRLPFPDNSFSLVVFDPPHLVRAGKQSWLAIKYGKLGKSWQEDIRDGLAECFRVLKPSGVLIFKWNENQIATTDVLALTNHRPLFGHTTGRRGQTIWLTFMKIE